MAVFLVNQCTFSKLNNIIDDPQLSSNASQPSPSSSSNICGLKFDSLLELIHHIEDNHITDVDYPSMPGPFHGAAQMAHPIQSHSSHSMMPSASMRDSSFYNVISHDRQHLTQIINGGWLPTSCVLRIFNSTHKPQRTSVISPMVANHMQPQIANMLHCGNHSIQPQQPQQLQQMQQPQQTAQLPVASPSPVVSVSPQITHGIINSFQPQQTIQQQQQVSVASPSPVVSVAPQMTHSMMNSIQPQQQPQQPPTPQQVSVVSPSPVVSVAPQMIHSINNSIQQQQQLQQPQQMQPAQVASPSPVVTVAPQITHNIINNIQPQQQTQPLATQPPTTPQQVTVAPPSPAVAVATLYKCSDCRKTYKTLHGLRTHQQAKHASNNNTETK